MTFESDIWLYLAPVILLCMLGIALLGLRRKDRMLGRFASGRLLAQLTSFASPARTYIKAGLIILAATLVALSLARPQLGIEWKERKAKGLDIVFVLDTSKSMLATDLRPTRLDRAKLAIRDIVQRLDSDRIGIVAFAGNAFLQTPPTLDYAAFRESLDSISPTIMTRGGSNLGAALREAANAFPQENNFKVCILLTDGEDLGGDALEAAEAIKDQNIQVHSIGIGTPEGDYLRIRAGNGQEEFIRDAAGSPVRSQLDEATLQQISQFTGGAYFRLSNQSLNDLYSSVLSVLPRQDLKSEVQEVRIERFQWFIGTAILLILLETLIRRRKTTRIALILLTGCSFITSPKSIQAQEPVTTPEPIVLPEDARAIYNLGVDQLSNGNYAEAADAFSAAVQATQDLKLQADALYNQAQAVNQLGETALQEQDFETAIKEWKTAEALFNSANQINPQDTQPNADQSKLEARRQALEDFLKQQEQPGENSQSQEPQEGDSESDSDEQSGEDQEGSEGEQGDQSQQEEQSGDSESSESDQQDGDPSESEQNGEDGESSESQEEGTEGEPNGEGESQPESTADPLDDIEQPEEAPGEESGEEANEQDGQAPSEENPEEAGEEGSATATTGAEGEAGEEMESVSLREANALLDSMRNSERLLPFTPKESNGPPRDRRDW